VRASVIIWGVVISAGSRVVPKFYLATDSQHEFGSNGKRIELTDSLHLSAGFESDLKAALSAAVVRAVGECEPILPPYSGRLVLYPSKTSYLDGEQRLSAFVVQVRSLLDGNIVWSERDKSAMTIYLLHGLLTLSEISGDKDLALEAVTRATAALNVSLSNEQLTAILSKLKATALYQLGKVTADGKTLRKAVYAYREAISTLTRESWLYQWAWIQNSLGNALLLASFPEDRTSMFPLELDLIEESIAAFGSAVDDYRAYSGRAAVLANFALAETFLFPLHRPSGGSLSQLELAFRDEEYFHIIRNEADGAMLKVALADRYCVRALYDSEVELLPKAVESYRAALKDIPKHLSPLEYAVAKNNLGVALELWSDVQRVLQYRRSAVAAYRQALRCTVMTVDSEVSLHNLQRACSSEQRLKLESQLGRFPLRGIQRRTDNVFGDVDFAGV
jgi:tetratricopeptide (TPR) repeat protein